MQMSSSNPISIRQLDAHDLALMEGLLANFGEAFEDVETYNSFRPSNTYLKRLLGRDYFIAIAALKNETVVGGIAAYELQKFEQERSEIYIYDLACCSRSSTRRNCYCVDPGIKENCCNASSLCYFRSGGHRG
jgi:aminoglycoside 3-N-acetyltransferase I